MWSQTTRPPPSLSNRISASQTSSTRSTSRAPMHKQCSARSGLLLPPHLPITRCGSICLCVSRTITLFIIACMDLVPIFSLSCLENLSVIRIIGIPFSLLPLPLFLCSYFALFSRLLKHNCSLSQSMCSVGTPLLHVIAKRVFLRANIAQSHSETSSASCLLLFDPSMPLSLASTAAASTSFWSDLVNVCSGQCVETPSGQMRCPGDQPPFVYPTYPAPPTCNLLLSNLSAAMNMSTQQASAVVQWLGGEFLNPLVREPLKEQFGVDDFEDLAYVQWGARRGVSLTSLADIYPGVFPIPPEYIKATDQVAPLNVTQCKKLLDGAMGINNMTHLPYFAEALAEAVASNQSTPLHPWGVDATEAEAVSVFWALGDESFSQQRLKDNIFPAGGGLITSRTVEEIMFYAYDPLLLYANPSDVNACIVCNFTSPDHCREKQLPSVYNTGKKNISLVAWTEQFEMSEYVYGYPEPYRVRGTNEIGQYEPFTQDDDDHHFPTFDNDYMRVLDLVPHGDVTLKGIPSRNYAISNETWAPNPAFDQSIQGFTNMAGLHNGSQIFLSNPHMWLANQSYIDKVTGMLESDYLRDGNSVVIEPISGAVLSLYVGIQVNMYMPKEQLFGLFHPNVTHDVMVPLVIAVEETVLTDAQANLWKYTIGLSQSALPYLYWGLLALGAFAVVAGTGMGVLLGLDLTTVRPTHDMAGYDLIY
eukprot:TRINITY_DN4645_c0_g1_i1.p1 TRINITY_DN4645_c0_g1~~TRINITY_DN4645_c0_g1_i1.p1  ORF type:complete len:703 (-),score=110.97 TRINITY_DN4645_c0_g1_i1:320-2428(-)